jgi:hypothetical protein
VESVVTAIWSLFVEFGPTAFDRPAVMESCSACGWTGVSLYRHHGRSPECKIEERIHDMPVQAGALHAKPSRHRCRFDAASFERELGKQVADMHLNAGMHIEHVLSAVALAKAVYNTVRKQVVGALQDAPKLQSEISGILDAIAATLSKMKQVTSQCEAQTIGAAIPIKRPICKSAADDTKHFCFFSLIQLLSDSIQRNAVTRAHILSTSREWSTGSMYRKPAATLTDITDGTRFRWSRLARPANPAEKVLRVRVGIDGWNDDFTVSVLI